MPNEVLCRPERDSSGDRNSSPNFGNFDGLMEFGKTLRAAARAVFPAQNRKPYREVHVLMLTWKDAANEESSDVSRLSRTFDIVFNFNVERFTIPQTEDCQFCLSQKVQDFINRGEKKERHLKIMYYKGNALTKDGDQLHWTSNNLNGAVEPASIEWISIQNALEQAQSDVLTLLDCPHEGAMMNYSVGGVKELIAARVYRNGLDQREPSSYFTRALEAELRELSTHPSFTVGNLYHNIYCRVYNQLALDGNEYLSPIYIPLNQTQRDSPRSIQISVHKISEDLLLSKQDPSEPRTPHEESTNVLSFIPPFIHSSAVVPGETPRIAFALRLNQNFRLADLSQDFLRQFLEDFPSSVAEVRIEGVFHSPSSLVIVSLPIFMSIYIRQDESILNLGPITSSNQVLSRVTISKDPPTPEPETLSWHHLQRMNRSYDLEYEKPKAKSGRNSSEDVNQQCEIRFRHVNRFGEVGEKMAIPHDRFSYSSSVSDETSFQPCKHDNSLKFASPPITVSHQIPEFSPHTAEAKGPQSKAHAKIRTASDDPESQFFPRISKKVELIRSTYDCVVIGSGYGGGVAASRMARAGQSVCLLERGKERWPGEYPCGFVDTMKQLHVSGEFAPGFLKGAGIEAGDPTGLYHLICGKGQNAFVGNGLGGTSLLNANIFLEADDKTMALPCWPEELRQKDALKKYYERAADVLEPEAYPHSWPELPKMKMLKRQAEALGWGEKFRRPRQTTRFRAGPNSTGVEMYPSALTGMDSTGLNDGSKSSTLVNYLSDAWNWGAEMFCECEVRYIKKHPTEGYLVFFAWHGSGRGAFSENLYEDLMWVHAKKCVFLGAGAIGTTEILLRSKKLGLSMSPRVGKGMSGNGDILAFGYNTDEEVNAIGREYPSPYKPVGPTISGVIDCRDQENPLDGFIIEEGAIPKALSFWLQTMLELMPGNQLPAGQSLAERFKHVLAQQGSRFLGPYFSKGSIERTQVYLVMSHDSNQAILTLKDDKPVLEFLGVGRSEHVRYLNEILKKATIAVGGTFVNSPFYAALGQQEITVHPIGGACMSHDGKGEHGVTNHFGEVFTGRGTETHPGLIVTDAAVIPAALGVNPFATITALAERSVEHAAKFRVLKPINLKTKNYLLNLFAEPGQFDGSETLKRRQSKRRSDAIEFVRKTREAQANGIGFSEIMSGYIHFGEGIEGEKREDYETAAKTAKGLCEEARFFLSVKAWDIALIVKRSDHRAMLTGTFTCAGIPGSPFMVHRGNFHLFSVDQQAPGTKNLTYEFDMTSTENRRYHFKGFKVVDSSVSLAPWKFWSAASTLYVTISDENERILGRGMMHIKPSDFLSQLFTLTPTGRNMISKIGSTFRFISFFAKQSANLFLAPLTWQQYPSVTYSGYINDTLPDKKIEIIAEDGVPTLMHIWEAQNHEIEPINIFMIPGAAVDQQIFSLPTIEVNAVNYFTRAGYRVHVTVHRICSLMVAENGWTTYDTRLDIKACLLWMRQTYGTEKIYTVAHCMGAVAFSSGLLSGSIPTSWIRGISCSQVFMNPIWSTLNMAKVLTGPIPIDKLYSWLGGEWFCCSSTRDDSYFQQLINQLLRFYPDSREEICNNVSCHRCSLIFGRLWNHKNLNEATHRQINRFFGGVNMTCLHLLMQMGAKGFVTANGPNYSKLTSDDNIKRLKGIPIMMFSGSDNKVLTPEATEKTYSILRKKFGIQGYQRHVIMGYGHLDCWMGREAYLDVFPLVREEIDRVCRGTSYQYVEPDWSDWNTWRTTQKQKLESGNESA